MIDIERLVHLAPLISACVAILTTIFVVIQIRSVSKSVQGQTYQRVYELMITIDKFFIENPGLKPYFYPDTKIAAEENVNPEKLASIAEMMIDFFDNVYHQKKTMPGDTFPGFDEYMKSVYRYSGVLRDYLRNSERVKWYPDDFLKDLGEDPKALRKLEETPKDVGQRKLS
jgi:hypothetical protein